MDKRRMDIKQMMDKQMIEKWEKEKITKKVMDKQWIEKWKKEIKELDALWARANSALNYTRYYDPVLLGYIKRDLKGFTRKLDGLIKNSEDKQKEEEIRYKAIMSEERERKKKEKKKK